MIYPWAVEIFHSYLKSYQRAHPLFYHWIPVRTAWNHQFFTIFFTIFSPRFLPIFHPFLDQPEWFSPRKPVADLGHSSCHPRWWRDSTMQGLRRPIRRFPGGLISGFLWCFHDVLCLKPLCLIIYWFCNDDISGFSWGFNNDWIIISGWTMVSRCFTHIKNMGSMINDGGSFFRGKSYLKIGDNPAGNPWVENHQAVELGTTGRAVVNTAKKCLVGDWNMAGLYGWMIFLSHHIGNVIIPTDFHSIIFQRGGEKPPRSDVFDAVIPTGSNLWVSQNLQKYITPKTNGFLYT